MPSIAVGKYLLHTEVRLGSGGFGEVHAASRRGSVETEDLAIKVGNRRGLNSKNKLRNTCDTNELHILQSIKHPNIVELCDHFVADHGRLHLVMRRAAGDLTVMVSQHHSCSSSSSCDLHTATSRPSTTTAAPSSAATTFDDYDQWNCSLQICLGLEFLHNKNILHRDLKPENILFFKGAGSGVNGSRSLVWKLADFGIGKEVDCAHVAQTHTVCGTHLYMAPEVLRGDRYFAAADLWSLGAVLHYVRFGKVLFTTPAQVLLWSTSNELDDFPGKNTLHADMSQRVKLKTVLSEITSNAKTMSHPNKLISSAPAEVLEAYFSSNTASQKFWSSNAGNEIMLECRPEARNAVLRNLPSIIASCTRSLRGSSSGSKLNKLVAPGGSGRSSSSSSGLRRSREKQNIKRDNKNNQNHTDAEDEEVDHMKSVSENDEEMSGDREMDSETEDAHSEVNSTVVGQPDQPPALSSLPVENSSATKKQKRGPFPFFLFRFLCINRKDQEALHLLDYADSVYDLKVCVPVFAAAFGRLMTEKLWAGLHSHKQWLSSWRVQWRPDEMGGGCTIEKTQPAAFLNNSKAVSGWTRKASV
ncbi:unnamed protein product [Amoebophrya sp. A120]|nr:unnamed protein product [Amoebophrya sp. A120]|eukprot:GSA120T00011896001.1